MGIGGLCYSGIVYRIYIKFFYKKMRVGFYSLDKEKHIRYSGAKGGWQMLKGIKDKDTLIVIALRMHDIQVKLLKGEALTEKELLQLKLYLGVPKFMDEEHRDRLFDEWWKGAKILHKKLKEEERKKK
jgi:hypothetical protein